jgi:hypothetical protein
MDTDAFFDRIKRRVAELEDAGKRIPADIKKTIRQRPQHGYRLDSIEKLAEALDWTIPELLAEIWQETKFSQATIPYGLHRHAVCLAFARKRYIVNQLMPPILEERRLEDLVAQLYQDWVGLERESGRPIDEATITAVFEKFYPQKPEHEPSSSSSSPSSDEPEDPGVPKIKAASDDYSDRPLAA